jgi:hypothetical protein
MADTNHFDATAGGRTEGDGISYRGLTWFMVVLIGTTLTCQVLMWGLFRVLEKRTAADDPGRPTMAAPMNTPAIESGRVVTGTPIPAPTLMVNEPLGLEDFRAREDAILSGYSWADKNAGTVRIPIDVAKKLLLQKGIPGGTNAPAAATAIKKVP